MSAILLLYFQNYRGKQPDEVYVDVRTIVRLISDYIEGLVEQQHNTGPSSKKHISSGSFGSAMDERTRNEEYARSKRVQRPGSFGWWLKVLYSVVYS